MSVRDREHGAIDGPPLRIFLNYRREDSSGGGKKDTTAVGATNVPLTVDPKMPK